MTTKLPLQAAGKNAGHTVKAFAPQEYSANFYAIHQNNPAILALIEFFHYIARQFSARNEAERLIAY